VETLGVDIGGVIMDKANDNTDTAFFGDNFLNTTAVPDTFEVLAALVQKRFGPNVHIVSKCGKKIEEKSRLWLAHHNFFGKTGIRAENLHFCLERHEKAPICERLRITHFIDDKLEVLSYLSTVEHKFLFQGSRNEIGRYQNFLPQVTQVNAWKEFLHIL
jgi:hypothetical protein